MKGLLLGAFLAFFIGQERGEIKSRVEKKTTQYLQTRKTGNRPETEQYRVLVSFFLEQKNPQGPSPEATQQAQKILLEIAKKESSFPVEYLSQLLSKHQISTHYLTKIMGVEAGIKDAIKKNQANAKQTQR